ncbi:hypothetical protein FDZ71_02605, partial [bacterium]
WMKRVIALFAACLLAAALFPSAASALRCATGVRSLPDKAFAHPAPTPRGLFSARTAAPVTVRNAKVHLTEHFQIFWGSAYPASDPDWADPDKDGVPIWVARLGASLEESFAEFEARGFPLPYGSETYYLDVYVGNTGVQVDTDNTAAESWWTVNIPSSYYAYTEIDKDFDVAWFVFSANFGYLNDLAILDAVAAHELFHAVQRGAGYPWNDEVLVSNTKFYAEMWWFEATATWMEDELFPDVNDYVYFVASEFLANPALALNTFDGAHEYGAAIFAGYVKKLCGSTLPFTEIAPEAFSTSMESALRNKVQACSSDTFENEVAKFWALAAHPADTWPDGAFYASGLLGSKIKSIGYVPYSYAPSSLGMPEKYGASLFSVSNPILPNRYSLSEMPTGADALVAVSAKGSSTAKIVARTEAMEKPAGTNNLYMAVVNASPSVPSLSYVLGVGNYPPLLAIIGDKSVAAGSLLDFTLSATDQNGDQLAFSAQGLPAGATLDPSTGHFSWQTGAGQAGIYPVNFSVTDGVSVDSENISITVGSVAGNRAPILTAIGNRQGSEAAALLIAPDAYDPDSDPLSFSVTGAPAGAAFNAGTGAFSWTPSVGQAGSYALTFTVSDGTLADSETIFLTITPQNRAPVLASVGPKTVVAGNALVIQLSATDEDGDSLSFGAGNAPPGGGVNAFSGVFYWQPTTSQIGTYSTTFTVSDGKLTDSETVTIKVVASSSSGGSGSAGCFIEALGGW